MKLIKPLVVQCEECNEIIEVYVDLECVSTDERQMGAEYQYEGIVEDNCPKCDNSIYINLSVWEYPEGAINDQDEIIEGAELLEGPDYDPFESDVFDF